LESSAIPMCYSLPAERVVRVLTQVESIRVSPRFIRVDNGPDLISPNLHVTGIVIWGLNTIISLLIDVNL
jgi:hypothetical protein